MTSLTSLTTMPQWRIQLRDHTLVPVGELPDYIDADLLPKFCDAGAWTLTVRADSPLAAYFAAGNGVIFSRDRGDGSGSEPQLSGPIWHLERRLKDNTYVLAGPTDEFWLAARRADPVTTYPYSATVLSLSGLLRSYRLGEASGSVASDASGHVNGAYSATGVTYGVAGALDDPDTAVTFNGASGTVTASNPTTAITNVTLWAWVRITGSTKGIVLHIGTGANGYGLGVGNGNADTAGSNLVGIFSSVRHLAPGAAALTLNTWHLVALSLDASSVPTFWLDGVSLGSVAGTAPNAPSTTLAIGSEDGASRYFGGSVDEVGCASRVLTASEQQTLYAVGKSRYAASAYDARTGTASTVIRGYVDANAGPGAISSRQVYGLALASDPAIGASVTGNARFDNLLTLCQQLAISGGDIGFKVIQTDVGVLTLSIYQPATKSNAIFSRELGNLLDAIYTLDGPTGGGNQFVAGGSGDGVARVMVANEDTASVATWGRVEGFIDARDTADTAVIEQRISAQLASDAQRTNLTITPVDTPALQFGRDYGLGDVVSVRIDGETITDIIRQVHITLQSGSQETIAPGIGNAGAGQIADLFDAKQRALAAVQQKLARLQAAQ